MKEGKEEGRVWRPVPSSQKSHKDNSVFHKSDRAIRKEQADWVLKSLSSPSPLEAKTDPASKSASQAECQLYTLQKSNLCWWFLCSRAGS